MARLDVKALRDATVAKLKEGVSDFRKYTNTVPVLAIILVGDNPASRSYVSAKEKMCAEVGIKTDDFVFGKNATEREVTELIGRLNSNNSVTGVLVQLPLPGHMNPLRVIDSIDPRKDVDGLTSRNLGRLLRGDDCVMPCTPKGILRILDHHRIPTDGKIVAVLNRSLIVGRPLCAALSSHFRNATVLSCNSKTPDASETVGLADIVVTAMNRPESIGLSWKFKEGAVIIDVTVARVPDSSAPKGYRVCGDLSAEVRNRRDISFTPVPGGVGLMTVAMLLENTLQLAVKARAESLPADFVERVTGLG